MLRKVDERFGSIDILIGKLGMMVESHKMIPVRFLTTSNDNNHIINKH